MEVTQTIATLSRANGEFYKTVEFQRLFVRAIVLALEPVVRLFLAVNPILISQEYDYQRSALHLAVMSRNANILQVLLNYHGININAVNCNGSTALACAARDGFCDGAQLLLKAGADVNLVNRVGETPLHCAVLRNRFAAVKLLLKTAKDIDIDRKTHTGGQTALYFACLYRYTNIIRLLIDVGAQVSPQISVLDTSAEINAILQQAQQLHFVLKRLPNGMCQIVSQVDARHQETVLAIGRDFTTTVQRAMQDYGL